MAKTVLMVCTTCKGVGEFDPEAPRPGAVLMQALAAETLPDDVELRPVECLSACNNGCTIALSAPGRWTYVYGRLDPAEHVAQIVEGATAYAATEDGLEPWRSRPQIFRKQSIARVPPQEQS